MAQRRQAVLPLSLALLTATPGLAQAEGLVPVEVVQGLLEKVQELGPNAPLAFAAGVAGAELLPLFPTALTMLASGLLFGGIKGAAIMVAGTSTAATLAFYLSRTIGRSYAQGFIKAEMGHAGSSSPTGAVARQLARVQEAVASGSPSQQLAAILVLRLLPIVPFSASNFFLGLTALPYPPFIVGTVVGELFWALLYGSLGGASRDLLEKGISMEELLGDLERQAGQYSVVGAQLGLGLGLAALVAWQVGKGRSRGAPGEAAETPPEATTSQRQDQVKQDQR